MEKKKQLRLNARYKISDYVTLQSRVEWSWYAFDTLEKS